MFDNCQIYDRTFCQEYFDKLAKWVQYNKCPEMWLAICITNILTVAALKNYKGCNCQNCEKYYSIHVKL